MKDILYYLFFAVFILFYVRTMLWDRTERKRKKSQEATDRVTATEVRMQLMTFMEENRYNTRTHQSACDWITDQHKQGRVSSKVLSEFVKESYQMFK